MVLDLLKRTESGNPLTLVQFDANYTAIEDAVNNKVDTTDSRMTNARAPTAHTHPQSDITNLVTDLSAKATTIALAALQLQVNGIQAGSGFVATSDSRLTDARAIANGSYTLFSVSGGVATLSADVVGPSHMANGDYGCF